MTSMISVKMLQIEHITTTTIAVSDKLRSNSTTAAVVTVTAAIAKILHRR
jgi:hypothetical protein